MHPTMLVGPCDWDSNRLPRNEFLERIENFWRAVADHKIFGAMVYGDNGNHAELAYLSHFTPKLGPALLLAVREGGRKLLVSGAPNMLAGARRLTWIEDVEPLRDAGKAIARWIKGSGGLRGSIAVIGGEHASADFYRPIVEEFGDDNPLVDLTPSLRALMRYKRPAELSVIREACKILTAATRKLTDASRSGAGIPAALLEAEHAANRAGAQDVRTLISSDGARTLRPFEQIVEDVVDPLQAYVAVRHAGYWAEGFVCAAAWQNPAVENAAAALHAVVGIAKSGVGCQELFRAAAAAVKPYQLHALTRAAIGNSIGLALEEEPRLLAGGEQTLQAGGVYSLRAGASDGRRHHAIVSAMVAAHADGSEVLWSAV